MKEWNRGYACGPQQRVFSYAKRHVSAQMIYKYTKHDDSRSFPKVYVRTRATYTQQTSTHRDNCFDISITQGSGAYIILETHDRRPTENRTRYPSCHYTGVYIGRFHTLSAVSQEVTGQFRRKDESLRTTRYCIDSINPRFKLFTHRYEILFLHLNA